VALLPWLSCAASIQTSPLTLRHVAEGDVKWLAPQFEPQQSWVLPVPVAAC
jgi:hypothetical protein